MRSHHHSALTLWETLIAISVFCLLVLILDAAVRPHLRSAHPYQRTLSAMKEIHLASQRMALDATTTGKTNIGWPGDIGGTFAHWAAQLVQGGYATTDEFCRWMSAPGITAEPSQFPALPHRAILVYAIREDSDGSTVYLTSANFTNTPTGGLPLSKDAKPYGDQAFLIFRKAGDGAVLQPTQVGKTNLIGRYVPLCQ